MFTSLNSPLTLLGTHTKYKGALFSVKKLTASEVAWREAPSPESLMSKTNFKQFSAIHTDWEQGVNFLKRDKKKKKSKILTKLIANN